MKYPNMCFITSLIYGQADECQWQNGICPLDNPAYRFECYYERFCKTVK